MNKKETAVQKVATDKLGMSVGDKGLMITTLTEMKEFTEIITNSGVCPKGYIGKPNDALVAILLGQELGLPPIQSLQCIAVVNGSPSLWGDAVPGLVIGSGLEEWSKAEQIGQKTSDGKYPDSFGFKYTSKRIGNPESHSITFTVADARKAGLWGKSGTWSQYPTRMLKYRARTFCYRDLYPDVLKGIHTVEEMRDVKDADYEVIDDRSRTDQVAGIVAPEQKAIAETSEVPPPVDRLEETEPEPSTQKQTSAIYAQCSKEYNIKQDKALKLASDLVKRELDTMKDLTKNEASWVIDNLNHRDTIEGHLIEINREKTSGQGQLKI